MAKNYTPIWNDFQFRSETRLFGEPSENIYDLVKWEEHEPYKVKDIDGNEKMSTLSCFSVGYLEWDDKDEYFTFHSCGMRYFNHHCDGLETWISLFAESETARRRMLKMSEEEKQFDF